VLLEELRKDIPRGSHAFTESEKNEKNRIKSSGNNEIKYRNK